MLTSGGLTLIRDWLGNTNPNPPLYIAVGSGQVTLGKYMTIVPGETWRGQISSITPQGFTVNFTTTLSTSDNPNQSVYCYGLIGGPATAAANTGTVVALQAEPSPYSKNASQTSTITFPITLSGVLS